MNVEDETPPLSNEARQDQESDGSEGSFALINSQDALLSQEGPKSQQALMPDAALCASKEGGDEQGSEHDESIQNAEVPALSLLKLRQTSVNYVYRSTKEGAQKDIKKHIARITMQPLTSGRLDYDDAPSVFPIEMTLALPRFSILYTISTFTCGNSLIASLTRQALQAQLGLSLDKLPMVDIFKGDAKVPYPATFVLVQCCDAETHAKVQREVASLELKADDKMLCTLERKYSGLRVKSEVCTVEFYPLIEDSEPLKLLEHDDAFRIAREFAIQFGATVCDDYPEAKDGLLQVWRERLWDVWADGTEIISDRNDFQLAMWIPKEVDRSTFLAYHRDSVTNRNIAFTFPGSDKYCSTCRDNTKHGEKICPKQSKAQWPLSYVKLPL